MANIIKYTLFVIGISICLFAIFSGINLISDHYYAPTYTIVDEKIVSAWNNSINITEFRSHWDSINYGSSPRDIGSTLDIVKMDKGVTVIEEGVNYILPKPFISHIVEPVEDYSLPIGSNGGASYTVKYANGSDVVFGVGDEASNDMYLSEYINYNETKFMRTRLSEENSKFMEMQKEFEFIQCKKGIANGGFSIDKFGRDDNIRDYLS